MSGGNGRNWTGAEERAFQDLYYQSRAYSNRFGSDTNGGLTFPQISQRMAQLNRSEGWPQRNYNGRSIGHYLYRHPELGLPPRTLDPAPRSDYDAEVLRRFRLRF